MISSDTGVTTEWVIEFSTVVDTPGGGSLCAGLRHNIMLVQCTAPGLKQEKSGSRKSQHTQVGRVRILFIDLYVAAVVL